MASPIGSQSNYFQRLFQSVDKFIPTGIMKSIDKDVKYRIYMYNTSFDKAKFHATAKHELIPGLVLPRTRSIFTYLDKQGIVCLEDYKHKKSESEKVRFLEEFFKENWNNAKMNSDLVRLPTFPQRSDLKQAEEECNKLCTLVDYLDQAVDEDDDEFAELLFKAGIPANTKHIAHFAVNGKLKMVTLFTGQISANKYNFVYSCFCQELVQNKDNADGKRKWSETHVVEMVAGAPDCLNQLQCLKYIITLEVDGSHWFPVSTEAIGIAAKRGRVEYVRTLMNATIHSLDKEKLTRISFEGWASLSQAKKKAHNECMDILAKAKMLDLNTAIELATENGSLDLIKLFVHHGGTPTIYHINQAATSGFKDCLEYLLTFTVNGTISSKKRIDDIWIDDETIIKSSLECIALLVKAKAKITKEALQTAAKLGKEDCLNILLNAEQFKPDDISIEDELITNDKLKCIEMLIAAKVKITKEAMLTTAKLGKLDCLKLFLNADAHVDEEIIRLAETNQHQICADLIKIAVKTKELEAREINLQDCVIL